MRNKICCLGREEKDWGIRFFQELRLGIEFEWMSFSVFQDFKSTMKQDLYFPDTKGVMVERDLSEEIFDLPLSPLKGVPQRILHLHCFDSLLLDQGGKWWPECFFRDVLLDEIVRKAPDLDISAEAYITVDKADKSGLARLAVSVAVQMGFQKISLASEKSDIESLLGSLQRLYLSTEFFSSYDRQITKQKNSASLLINSINLSQSQELMEDLAYLNFMYNHGLVVDLSGDASFNLVLNEAGQIGLRVLTAPRIKALSEWQILVKILGHLEISQEEYCEKRISFLKNPS